MATTTPEEIQVGEIEIRFLVEGEQSRGSVAVLRGACAGRREGAGRA
jgi:hypothetical protein